MTHKPSKYQTAIYKAFQLTNKNISISAVAGSGKTTVLLGLLNYVPQDSRALFLAFNKSIVEELCQRNTRKNVQIMTIHSCGWRAIMCRYGSKVRMNPNKGIAKTEMVIKNKKIPDNKRGYYFYIIPKILDLMRCNLCSNTIEDITKLTLHYALNVEEEDVKIAQKVFEYMISDRSQFDFMDMIYMPLVDNTIRLQRYDCVFCDESQDFSLCQQEFIKHVLNRRGRLVTVGDRNQAIYGFAGADAESYDKLALLNGKSIRMPLSVCYRCDKSIIREAQRYVPEIQSFENASDGHVWQDGSLTEIRQGDWILCRNLKPLVQTYLWLLKNKIKSKIRGKDIGEGIVNLIIKVGSKTIPGLLEGLEHEKDKLFTKLRQRGVRHPAYHPKAELLQQRIEVIQCLANEVESVKQLRELIDTIFSDNIKGIMLSTIHKAKGLENDRIFFLLPELIPSKFAETDWQFEQEMNLCYVAITRAKKELTYVHTNQFLEDINSKVFM